MRAIGRWSLTALVINSTIGSGIFGLPSVVGGMLGPASVYAYLLAAAGIGIIMACLAEVASQFRDAGGPYLYARAALGRFTGIQVAWLVWLTRLASAAANANLFVIYLAEFWPAASRPLNRLFILTLVVGVLAVVNYRGVSSGTQVSNFFTLAKLLPLAIFIVAGLLYLHSHGRVPLQPTAALHWSEALLLLVFAYGGFESATLPMAEAKDPRRNAPFALLVSLAATTLIYTLVQVVVMGTLSDPTATDRPLAAAVRVIAGPLGAALMSVGALAAVYGLMSSSMLNTPRLTYALAQRGDFPAQFAAVHPRFRTPHVSIVVYSVLSWVLTVAGSFRWNATLSAVSRLVVYGCVCLSLVALRRKQPEAEAFRLPVGAGFATVGMAFCAILVSRMGRGELIILAATGTIALLNWLWVRQRSVRPVSSAAKSP